MVDYSFEIALEKPDDFAAIEALHDLAFGPGRFARTAWRMREGVPAIEALSYAAWSPDRLIGSVRFTAVALAGQPGLMLGPLAVKPSWKGRGVGLKLMQVSLEAVRCQGNDWVILVGDEPYYARVGFGRVAERGIKLPGPVDPARLLVLELRAGALDGFSGVVQPIKDGA